MQILTPESQLEVFGPSAVLLETSELRTHDFARPLCADTWLWKYKGNDLNRREVTGHTSKEEYQNDAGDDCGNAVLHTEVCSLQMRHVLLPSSSHLGCRTAVDLCLRHATLGAFSVKQPCNRGHAVMFIKPSVWSASAASCTVRCTNVQLRSRSQEERRVEKLICLSVKEGSCPLGKLKNAL